MSVASPVTGSVVPGNLLVIACGALAREIVWLQNTGLEHMQSGVSDRSAVSRCRVTQHPEADPGRNCGQRSLEYRGNQYQHIFVAYGDCGTGGEIDRALWPRPETL